MAMTLRLPEDLDRALTERARLEARSKQDIAHEAITLYLDRKRELLDTLLDTQLPRYADALDRLGQ